MKKWKNILGLLLLFSFCALSLTACANFSPQPSKKDVIAYVEESYGEKPHVISTVTFEESKGSHITVYTLRINKDNPVEFTVESGLGQGNYGPVGSMKDLHNRDVAVDKEEAAKELARTYGVGLKTDSDSYASTITLYLNQESQLSETTRILSELDELYSFVYTDKGVKIHVKIILQSGSDEEITETIDFKDFRKIFDTDFIPITAIESLFKVQPKEEISLITRTIYQSYSKENLSRINRAIYDAWSKETGYTFEEIYPSPNPLRTNPDYLECGDCNGRGAIGWGKKRVECLSCGSLGFIPKETGNPEEYGTN